MGAKMLIVCISLTIAGQLLTMSLFWIGIQADLHSEYEGSVSLMATNFPKLLKKQIFPHGKWLLDKSGNTYIWRMFLSTNQFDLLDNEQLNKQLEIMAKEFEDRCKLSEVQASNLYVCNFLSVMQKNIGNLQERMGSVEEKMTRMEEKIETIDNRLTRVEHSLDRLLAHFGLDQ
jgi:hypothetical protein